MVELTKIGGWFMSPKTNNIEKFLLISLSTILGLSLLFLLIYISIYFLVGGFVTEEDEEMVLTHSENFINDIYTESTGFIYNEHFSTIPTKQSQNLVTKFIAEAREYDLLQIDLEAIEFIAKGKPRGRTDRGEKYSYETFTVTIETIVEKDGQIQTVRWELVWADKGDKLKLIEIPKLEEIINGE
jgi:hypothetical protein